jgi:hypothetical protein
MFIFVERADVMTLNASYHFPALRLILDGSQQYKVVRTICDAADVLVNDWPADDGEEYLGALVACLNAYYETVPASVVRDALIKAANEVSIPHISLVSQDVGQPHRARG